MKRIFYIVTLSLILKNVSGQTSTNYQDSTHGFFVGFDMGLLLSKFYPGNNNDISIFSTTYEKSPKSGFSVGISFNPQSKHFGGRLGINYTFIHHDIKFKSSSVTPGTNSFTTCNYTLYSSFIRFVFLPTFTIGHKTKSTFFIGPYLNLPIAEFKKGYYYSTTNMWTYPTKYDTLIDNEIKKSLNSSYGFLLGYGIKKALHKDYVGLEFIMGLSGDDIIASPSLKEYFISIRMTYFLKIK